MGIVTRSVSEDKPAIQGIPRLRFGLPSRPHTLAHIIHEQARVLQNIYVEKELQLSFPKHCVNQPERASVRFVRRLQQPWASAQRLMNNPGYILKLDAGSKL
jgi:hypothetical protein